MSWLRSAAIYLLLTAIILGAVWLFWGDKLESAWLKMRGNPVIAEKIPREIEKKKAGLKRPESPKMPAVEKMAEKLPATAAAEWQKTRSGATGLLELQARETRRDMEILAEKSDNRTVAILRSLKLYREPKPPNLNVPAGVAPQVKPDKKPEIPPAKIEKKPAKPKKEREKKNELLKPMI